MKVLLVDDEKLIRDVIKEYLIDANILFVEASNGKEAIEKAKTNDIDLIIMDVMMPEMDGLTALKKIYETKHIPTIVLSARKEEYDKLIGFDLGIDDYVTKPFSPKELIARVKAIYKRYKKEDIYKYKTLEVNFLSHTVKIDNKKINLTPKEYELLKYFIINKGIAISREQLLLKIWGYDFYGDDRTIDTHVKMLRSSLKQYRNLIETVRGTGYKYEEN